MAVFFPKVLEKLKNYKRQRIQNLVGRAWMLKNRPNLRSYLAAALVQLQNGRMGCARL